VRDIVDQDGAAVSHVMYDAFGNIVGGTGVLLTRYLWTGRELDTLTGLQYNRNRWYDPTLGRWLSEDPIGFWGGDYNLGRYVRNSVAVFTDPDGLECFRMSWPSWEDYPYYFWNPSEMDSDLRVTRTIARGTAAAAGGAALGLTAGSATAAYYIAGGAAAVDASAASTAVGLTVGVNSGYLLGLPFGPDVAQIGSLGASYIMPVATIIAAGKSGLPNSCAD
jgi:RHS repeat-associated protein